MGLNVSKQTSEIVRNITTETYNNTVVRNIDSSAVVGSTTVTQVISTGDINAKGGCAISIGSSDQSVSVKVVTNISKKINTEIVNEITKKINDKLTQLQTLDQQLGGGLLQANVVNTIAKVRQNLHDVVSNSATLENINKQLISFNANTLKEIIVGNIVCDEGATIRVGSSTVAINAQLEHISNNVASNIINNRNSQELISELEQSTKITQSVFGLFGGVCVGMVLVCCLLSMYKKLSSSTSSSSSQPPTQISLNTVLMGCLSLMGVVLVVGIVIVIKTWD